MASVMQYRCTSPANISDTTGEENRARVRERERQGHNGMVIVVVAPDDEKKAVERGALAIDANAKASGLMYGNLQSYCGPTGTNENVMWVPPCRL